MDLLEDEGDSPFLKACKQRDQAIAERDDFERAYEIVAQREHLITKERDFAVSLIKELEEELLRVITFNEGKIEEPISLRLAKSAITLIQKWRTQ